MDHTKPEPRALVVAPDTTPAPLAALARRTLGAITAPVDLDPASTCCANCGHEADEHTSPWRLGACLHATLLTMALHVTHYCECHSFVPVYAELPAGLLSLPIGIEIGHRAVVRVIERGTALPVSAWWFLTTRHDNQNELEVRVVQGEVGRSGRHETFAALLVTGLPPAPRGMTVRVSIAVDRDGIVSFTAHRDRADDLLDVQVTSTNMLARPDIEPLAHEEDQPGESLRQ